MSRPKRYGTRSKERVEFKHFTDGVSHGSCFYTQYVYRREDGTEYIHPEQTVTRVDGVATVERHAKTVQALSILDAIEDLKTKARVAADAGRDVQIDVVILPDK